MRCYSKFYLIDSNYSIEALTAYSNSFATADSDSIACSYHFIVDSFLVNFTGASYLADSFNSYSCSTVAFIVGPCLGFTYSFHPYCLGNYLTYLRRAFGP